MARAEASARLGWQASATLRREGADSARLVVRVVGADTRPVRSARLTAELIHNIEAAHPVRAVLDETGDGRYEAVVALRRTGMWEVRLDARRDAARFSTSLRTEAFAPPAGAR